MMTRRHISCSVFLLSFLPVLVTATMAAFQTVPTNNVSWRKRNAVSCFPLNSKRRNRPKIRSNRNKSDHEYDSSQNIVPPPNRGPNHDKSLRINGTINGRGKEVEITKRFTMMELRRQLLAKTRSLHAAVATNHLMKHHSTKGKSISNFRRIQKKDYIRRAQQCSMQSLQVLKGGNGSTCNSRSAGGSGTRSKKKHYASGMAWRPQDRSTSQKRCRQYNT
mmetsp:Transcript_15709/g.24436  ORF Transcript_15709/g.24436 Transcript_15709/m.24436 type:complete len:220 (+) Transcript_15709:115-774(+)